MLRTLLVACAALDLAACGRPAEPSFESACAAVAPDEQRSARLLLWARSVEDVDGGVVMHLGPEAPGPDRVVVRARCHRAWMAKTAARWPAR